MKKLLMFLAGLILISLMAGMVFVGAAIYNTESQRTIDTFFFQPADIADRRIANPKPIGALSEFDLMYRLMDKFVTEYFYVVPDRNNIDARMQGGRDNSLYVMSEPPVFNTWLKTTATDISKLTAQKVMRWARVVNMEPETAGQGWWRVDYELITWEKPNDLSSDGKRSFGTMYVKIRFEPGIRDELREQPFNVGDFLENGGDPSLIFKFRVEQLEHGSTGL